MIRVLRQRRALALVPILLLGLFAIASSLNGWFGLSIVDRTQAGELPEAPLGLENVIRYGDGELSP